MKKKYILILLLTISITTISFGQEMLLNGGFENWDDEASPTSWTKSENITKSTDAHSGTYSAVRDGGDGTKDLGQTINGITAGASYTISFWYKVTAGDDSDARVWSYWKGIDNVSVTDEATDGALRGPNNSYLDNNGGVWSKYEATVVAPNEGVFDFYFEVRSYKNSTVYFDDLSFVKNATASLKNNAIEGFEMYPNPITSNNLTISSNSSEAKEITLFNVIGKKVLSTSFTGVNKILDVSSINSGIYILKVTESGKTITKKLVIK